jgi:hypothetical protein
MPKKKRMDTSFLYDDSYDEDLEWYKQYRFACIRRYPGKYLIIKYRRIQSVHDDVLEALNTAYMEYGNSRFILRRAVLESGEAVEDLLNQKAENSPGNVSRITSLEQALSVILKNRKKHRDATLQL